MLLCVYTSTGLHAYVRDARTHPHVEVDDPAGETETVLEIGRGARWTRE